ncbi:prepilin-type N-terminal cleavage/methylation domain-containing protein, partial [Clostridium saudiense]|nr:prepilin-type N-terminal cleavage/methylation domain-containing protein [Clostridium saudiense]
MKRKKGFTLIELMVA